MKIPHPDLGEEKLWGVEFPEHRYGKAAIERNPAMVRENQTDY
jgi:hypothetical protein